MIRRSPLASPRVHLCLGALSQARFRGSVRKLGPTSPKRRWTPEDLLCAHFWSCRANFRGAKGFRCRNVFQSGRFAWKEQQRSSFMKLAIAGLLLAIGAGSAIAQTTSPGTSTAPDSAATGVAPGAPPATPAERPRTQGNVPATTPGGPASSESSGPDPSKPMTPTTPDKPDPSPK